MLIEPIAQAVAPYASLITFFLIVILMALFALKYRFIKIRKRRGNPSLLSIYNEIGQQHDDTREGSHDMLTALINEREYVLVELATIIKNTKPSETMWDRHKAEQIMAKNIQNAEAEAEHWKSRCREARERVSSNIADKVANQLKERSSEDEVTQRIIETLRADSIGLWNANQALKRRIRELEAQTTSPLPTEESNERDAVLSFFGKLAKSLAANPEGE